MNGWGAGGAFVAVLGLPLIALSAWYWARWRRARGWPRVPATVLRCRLREFTLSGGDGPIPAWQPEVEFRFVHAGQERTGTRLCADERAWIFTSHHRALGAVARFRPGRELQARLAPSGEAVLVDDVDWARKSHYLGVGGGGLLLLAAGLALAWTGI